MYPQELWGTGQICPWGSLPHRSKDNKIDGQPVFRGGTRSGLCGEVLELYQKWNDQAESGKDSLTAHLGAWRQIHKQLLRARQLTGESQMGSTLG